MPVPSSCRSLVAFKHLKGNHWLMAGCYQADNLLPWAFPAWFRHLCCGACGNSMSFQRFSRKNWNRHDWDYGRFCNRRRCRDNHIQCPSMMIFACMTHQVNTLKWELVFLQDQILRKKLKKNLSSFPSFFHAVFSTHQCRPILLDLLAQRPYHKITEQFWPQQITQN